MIRSYSTPGSNMLVWSVQWWGSNISFMNSIWFWKDIDDEDPQLWCLTQYCQRFWRDLTSILDLLRCSIQLHYRIPSSTNRILNRAIGVAHLTLSQLICPDRTPSCPSCVAHTTHMPPVMCVSRTQWFRELKTSCLVQPGNGYFTLKDITLGSYKISSITLAGEQ